MRFLRALRGWVVLPVLIVVLGSGASTVVDAEDPVPGSQGIDTSLPATDSEVTVRGRGRFADLEITVNQTENLTNQAVSITWTGGAPTRQGPGRFAGNYLQIMQCWGDDEGTVPENPGPPPEQCVQGAVGGTFGGISGGLYPSGLALSRIISRSEWGNYDPDVGVLDPRTTNVWRPFRAVDGTVIDIHTDPNFNPAVQGGNFWLNPYFNIVTTNEIAGGATGTDGRGAELFRVTTGIESTGLGCGQRVQPVPGGEPKVPQCWIVVVPRGLPAEENAGTPFEAQADQFGVVTSPLSPTAWANRVAIPIEFNPVDSPCRLGDDERRIAGTELALPAVASWQPLLCVGGALPPFSFAPVPDAAARQQLAFPSPGAPGMVAVSRPLDESQLDPDDPVVYAPLTLSGVVIGYNVERNPKPSAPDGAQRLAGVRVAEMNLTPRLVAKLLSQSYALQVQIRETPPYDWLGGNPGHMGVDPDFLRFNPEFALLDVGNARTFGGLQLPAGSSDAAQQVWEWVLADPEAKAWLDGEPDEWGMRVNPVYSTNPDVNPTGIPFGQPAPASFPKADPFCHEAPPRGVNDAVVPPPLCGTDWVPYVRSFAEAAVVTRAAADRPRIVENPFAVVSSEAWERELPQFIGRRSILALTDTVSAAQFGLQVARLSRAGDNGDDRTFIAPDTRSLTAGVESMEPVDEPQVLEPQPLADAPQAYPLTTLTYAASAPLSLDDEARADYAAFLEYAVEPGQEPGLELGQLPLGYAPLPLDLQIQAVFAAELVREGELLEPPVPPTTTTTTVPPTTTAPPTSTTTSTTTTTTTTTAPASFPSAPNPFPSGSPTSPVFTPPGNAQPPAPASPSGGDGGGETSSTTTPTETTAAPTSTTPPTTVPAVPEESPDDAPAGVTPVTELGGIRLAVPGLGAVALASALAALEITKRPRRMHGSDGEADLDVDVSGLEEQ